MNFQETNRREQRTREENHLRNAQMLNAFERAVRELRHDTVDAIERVTPGPSSRGLPSPRRPAPMPPTTVSQTPSSGIGSSVAGTPSTGGRSPAVPAIIVPSSSMTTHARRLAPVVHEVDLGSGEEYEEPRPVSPEQAVRPFPQGNYSSIIIAVKTMLRIIISDKV